MAVLQRLQLRKSLENEAAYVLTNMAKVGLNNKKQRKECEKNNRKIFSNIKHHLGEFRQTFRLNYNKNFLTQVRQIKTTDDGSNITEEMTRQFEMMRDEIKEVKKQNQDLCNIISQLTNFLQSKQDRILGFTPNQEGELIILPEKEVKGTE